jgi:hypothetical protein
MRGAKKTGAASREGPLERTQSLQLRERLRHRQPRLRPSWTSGSSIGKWLLTHAAGEPVVVVQLGSDVGPELFELCAVRLPESMPPIIARAKSA